MKRFFLLASIFLTSTLSSLNAEMLHTFYGTMVQVTCGEGGKTGISYLEQEVGINEPFAVALNWTINFYGTCRYISRQREVYVSSLSSSIHAMRDGGGYNRTGIKLLIYREPNGENGYYYYTQEETHYDNRACVHNE